jgi:anti-sigma B factor antagonist
MNFKHRIHSDILYLQFKGDLIGEDQGQELFDIVSNAIEGGLQFCAIDISDVRYVNSSGIGVMITILTKFRNKGGEVVLVKPSEHVRKLLVMTKLTNIFKVVENVEDAEQAFQVNGN